jgi:hypothetical protein
VLLNYPFLSPVKIIFQNFSFFFTDTVADMAVRLHKVISEKKPPKFRSFSVVFPADPLDPKAIDVAYFIPLCLVLALRPVSVI